LMQMPDLNDIRIKPHQEVRHNKIRIWDQGPVPTCSEDFDDYVPMIRQHKPKGGLNLVPEERRGCLNPTPNLQNAAPLNRVVVVPQ
jgi:hypothetical protein